ncbi:MAG: hypothetical protein ACKVPJ_00090 [Chitinophagales bacterium]
MKTCPHCKKENSSDFEYCRYCGNPIQFVPNDKPKTFWKKIPSWAWVLIFLAGGILMIGFFIGSFVALTTLEGFASGALLIAGIVGFGIVPLRKPEEPDALMRGIGIAFFALMGATVDQTGNFIYNKPVEMCFCEEGTSLQRAEDVSNPLPGTYYVEQDYTCFDTAGNPVKQINMFAVMGLRFVEYVLLGYLLIWLRRFLWRMKN